MSPLRRTLGRPAKSSKFDLLPCCYSKLPTAHEGLITTCSKYGVQFSSKRLPPMPFPERFGSSVTQYYVSLIRSLVVKHEGLQYERSQKAGQKFESMIRSGFAKSVKDFLAKQLAGILTDMRFSLRLSRVRHTNYMCN